MISREDLGAIKTQYIQTRDRMIANVNVTQGAVDAVEALLKLCDSRDAEAKAQEKEKKNGS